MDEVVGIGEVTDEVLLLCGTPDSAPSAWWTPSLVDHAPDRLERLLAATEWLLQDVGAREPRTRRLVGPLGEVARLVADARLVVLVETAGGPAGEGVGLRERRSVVVAEDLALLDRQDPAEGLHDLLVATPRAAVGLLADLLTPRQAPTPAVRSLAGRRTPGEVAATLPEGERIATTRITRTVVARDGEPGGVHMVTLVEHDAGAAACWALPGGDVHVRVMDEDGPVDVALALLGADTVEVAA